MQGVELVDPQGYAPWWTFVGIAMLALLLAWYVFVFWSTRKRPGEVELPRAKRTTPAMPGQPRDPFDAVRAIYLERLEEIKARHAAGELDTRGVHLEIRQVMRDYTKARTGVDAETFTSLDAARVSLTGPLAKSLKNLSYPSFARSSTAKPSHSLFRARQVIQKW